MDKQDLITFALRHKDEDPLRLLMQQAKYPDVDMKLVAQQIEGMRQASAKWPTLACCDAVIYPPKLNREQSSSEMAARYKAEKAVGRQSKVADLTGGMGVDSLFLAQWSDRVDYVEKEPSLVDLAEHNFDVLGAHNITCHCEDSIEWLRCGEAHYDALFIDPARRDERGRKVAAFEDCTPNLLEHLELITSKCDRLIVKASPMVDIEQGCRQLGKVSKVFVVAVSGECKEVLLVVCSEGVSGEPEITCADLRKGSVQEITFTRTGEEQAAVQYCSHVKRYIYEPNAALMKGGAYRSLSERYCLEKLARNTHLYTSETLLSGEKSFPGRVFEVEAEVKLNKKGVGSRIAEGKAHVVTRNYPVAAAELQQQLGLKEGGDKFVIATTVGTRHTGFVCRMVKD